MKLSHWFWLIGLTAGLGCLQVAQRNALFLKAYDVGHRIEQAHEEETRLGWLSVRVTGLHSPGRLSEQAAVRRLNLVAWSPLASESAQAMPTVSVARVASAPVDDAPPADDTAD